MKSIVRRDTTESYTEYLKRLAETAGLEATDEAALRRMDRGRRKWAAGAAGGGLRQSATDQRESRQAVIATARRTRRADSCPCL